MIGRVLDNRYEIQERIARGGMATVYIAQDLRLQRTVALKVMHEGLHSDATFAARFVREARSAALIDHPNVVAVFDQGEDADGTLYLAMELVRGKTLRDMIGAPMPPAKALSLMEPVLAALAAAHRAGIVHRDVKPENVLIAPASPGTPGRVKVADFGLARAVTAETQHTSTGTVIGTVSYLAPELVERGTADARVDVYAAGVMLYELLTGKKPHQGESPIQVAYKHVHEDVPAPSASVPGIPEFLDALVARATARDKDARLADGSVFLNQLRRVAQTLAEGITDDPELTADLRLPSRLPEPTQVLQGDDTAPVERTQERKLPPSAATAAPESRRRRRKFALLLVVLLLIGGLIGAGGWWWLDGRYTTTPDVEGLSQTAATTKLEQMGFHVTVGAQRFSSVDPKGTVAATAPSAGARVLDHGTITLFPSRGIEQYAIPNLTGKPYDDAVAALTAIKMTPVKTLDWSDDITTGAVIKTVPAAGKVLRPGSAVTVSVSKGQQPFKVPDWTNKSAASAQHWASKAQLKVTTTSDYSDTVAAGNVISQSVPPDSILHHGDAFSMVVSKGPPVVDVPDIEGMSWNDAVNALKAVGLDAAAGNDAARAAQLFFPTVGLADHTDPKRGKPVRVGSTVRIFF